MPLENIVQIFYHKVTNRLKWYRSRYFKYHYTKAVDKSIKKNNSPKTIYLFCPPIHPNLGDQAQTMCMMRWFKTYYPQHKILWIPMQLSSQTTIADVRQRIKPEDLVFVHSGYLTTEMYGYLPFMCDIAEAFPDNKIIILPQTVNIRTAEMRDKVAKAFSKNKNLTFLCRDDISYEKAKEMFSCRVELYPDFVTSLIGKDEFDYKQKRDGILFIIRDDKEKLYSDDEIDSLKARFNKKGIKTDAIDTTIKISPFAWVNKREKVIKKYLKLISQYECVITDRYHGTIFSQVVSTPTIVISSNDHKLVSGVKWFPAGEFGDRLYFANNLAEAEAIAAKILARGPMPTCRSQYFEENYWSKLAELIK